MKFAYGALLILCFAFTIQARSPSYRSKEYEVQSGENFTPRLPNHLKSSKAFKKFIKIVEENKLNFTLFVTEGDYDTEAELVELSSFSFRMPPSAAHPTTSTLTPKLTEEFLKTAAKEHITANARTSTSTSDDLKTNNRGETLQPRVYKLLTSLKPPQDLIYDAKNFAAIYTYITPGAEKNDTTIVMFGNLDIKILLEKNITPEEKKELEKIIPLIHFSIKDYDLKAEVLAKHFDKKFPNQNWQAVIDNEGGYVHTDKELLVEVLDNKISLFTFGK